MRKLGLLSGRAKTRSISDLDPDRYEFLSLENAEPNLGMPDDDNAIAGSNSDGSRKWLYPRAGLIVNQNNEIIVDEDTMFIDTSAFINSDADNLHAVLSDFDDDIASKWIVIDSNYVAENSDKIIANTAAGTFGISLPALPQTGFWVRISDPGTWLTNALIINRNGSTIEGLPNNLTLDEENLTVEFVYNGATWEVLRNSGPRGYTGSQGDVGFTGSQGETGYTGSKGDTGFTGSQGEIGYTGSKGDTGFTGSQGEIGYTGSKGDTGFTGSQGEIGYTGSQGEIGFTGSQGYTGSAGFAGSAGFTGSQAFSLTDDTITGDGTLSTPYSVVKWRDTIDLTLDGAVEGVVSFDGSQNVTLTTTLTATYEFTKTLTLTDSWIDVGISSTDLDTGTYIIQIFMNDTTVGNNTNEYLSGIMSWYNGTTNPVTGFTSDEIPLHRSGEQTQANIFLRTFRSTQLSGEGIKLQLFSTAVNSGSSNYIFKFKKLL